VFNQRKRRDASTYFLTRWLFFRGLGMIFLLAFVSLWVQIDGLIGSQGILPVEPWLDAVRERVGVERYWLLPSVFWMNAGDAVLHSACAVAVFLSVCLILDVVPVLSLCLLWGLYLSFTSVCQDFLSFQWDNLLLETAFLAIFLAPLRWKPRKTSDAGPSSLVLWLFRWLLFRLMFCSGLVKLASGDITWRNMTALTFHYETQPIPNWISWYAHQLPEWFQRFSCATMFGIELIVPFFIFGPPRIRRFAAILLIAFQVLIIITGNYAFFNLITILLCVLLLDDAVWFDRLKKIVGSPADKAVGDNLQWRWPRWIPVLLTAVILIVSFSHLLNPVGFRGKWPKPMLALQRWVGPFRTINSYGLFAVMTTTRPEIVVQGSQDGSTWLDYAFKYKPGDVNRPPPYVAPHQPRLDWQMWFAALGSYRQNPWFIQFCGKLLEGSPSVLALLSDNPFPDRAPRYVRAVVYQYHFSDGETRRLQGAWWTREFKGFYAPVMSMQQATRN
jgi:lipase maturation factor 1